MNIVVACCKNKGIGFKNALPWRLKKELNYFKYLTKGNNNAVIMGKNTCLSIKKPLPKRSNFVLSSTLKENYNNFNVIRNIDDIPMDNYNNIWVIGGEGIYNSLIEDERVCSIFFTQIENNFKCDTFFPDIPNDYKKIYKSKYHNENRCKYSFQLYINEKNILKYNSADYNYALRYINKIRIAEFLSHGP